MLRSAIVLTLLVAVIAATRPANAQQVTATATSFDATVQRLPSLDHAEGTVAARGTGEDAVVVARLGDLQLSLADSTALTLMHSSSLTYAAGTPNLLQIYRDVSDRWAAERRTRDRTSALLGWSADPLKVEAGDSSSSSGNSVLKRVARFINSDESSQPPLGQHICQCGSMQVSPMHCGSGAR